MKLADLLTRAVKPRLHERFGEIYLVSDEFDEDEANNEAVEIADAGKSLSGLALVLEYRDSRGRTSQRIVTCKQFAVQAGTEFLKAYCHQRGGPRSFRIDRIVDIFDPQTGESLSPVQAFFAQFSPDKVTRSGLTWGLSVSKRADLIALLNALIFIARCDREFHPTERSSLEHALTSFWLRLELPGDPDFEDILNYSDRLSPDGETFWLAMRRFKEEPELARIFKRQSMLLIEADGVVRQEEAYWAVEIDDFLSED